MKIITVLQPSKHRMYIDTYIIIIIINLQVVQNLELRSKYAVQCLNIELDSTTPVSNSTVRSTCRRVLHKSNGYEEHVCMHKYIYIK